MMPFAVALLLPLTVLGGMKTYRSKEANIKSNAPSAEVKALGKRIDRYCGLFEEFYDELGLKKKSNNTLKLRLFATYDEYEDFYRRSGAGLGGTPLAFFSPSLNSIVMYSDEADVALRAVVFHESSHQFLNRYTSDAPKWANEGLAEFFEGWKVPDNGEPPTRRPHLYDLKLVQQALRKDEYLDPAELVGMSAQTFIDFAKEYPDLHSYLHYATSWSLVYYGLMTSHEEDGERMLGYYRDLREKGPSAKFVVDDWTAFTERWKAYILGLDPKPQDAVDHFLVASGYRASREWVQAAGSFATALDLDPEIPGARYWRGYCLKRNGNYAKAFEVLAEALAETPEDPRIPYYLARMHLGIDKKGATPNLEEALRYAELASELVGDESPLYLELIARCYLAAGDKKRALRFAKKILKVVDKDDLEAWEKKVDQLRADAK